MGDVNPWVWKVKVHARDKWCLMAKQNQCVLPLQAAHIISQQHLKQRKLPLWDVRNGMCLCVRHHNRHDRHLERVPRDRLPKEITGFCEEHRIGYLLDKQYPKEKP